MTIVACVTCGATARVLFHAPDDSVADLLETWLRVHNCKPRRCAYGR